MTTYLQSLRPVGYKILLKRIKAEPKKSGLILLKEPPSNLYQVIAVGTGDFEVMPGDQVMVDTYAGKGHTIAEDYLLVKGDQILGKFT